jgi:hypothetical protein
MRPTTTSLFSVNRLMMWASAPVLIASLVACGDSSTEPTSTVAAADVALAAELEGVAQSARAAGDGARETAFAFAAEAVRLGIQPSTLIVSNDGVEQRFDAYVNAVDRRGLTEADRVGRRTLTGWRRTEGGTQLIYIGSPAAAAQVSPAGNDGAAWYFDARTQTRWAGVSGSVTIAELESGGACAIVSRASRAPKSSCTKAVFEVGFDVRFEQEGTDRSGARSSNLKGISAADQRVNGAKLSP